MMKIALICISFFLLFSSQNSRYSSGFVVVQLFFNVLVINNILVVRNLDMPQTLYLRRIFFISILSYTYRRTESTDVTRVNNTHLGEITSPTFVAMATDGNLDDADIVCHEQTHEIHFPPITNAFSDWKRALLPRAWPFISIWYPKNKKHISRAYKFYLNPLS